MKVIILLNECCGILLAERLHAPSTFTIRIEFLKTIWSNTNIKLFGALFGLKRIEYKYSVEL